MMRSNRYGLLMLALGLFVKLSAAVLHHMPGLASLITEITWEMRNVYDQSALQKGTVPSLLIRTLLRAQDTMLFTCENCACDICVNMNLNKRGEFAPAETAIFAHILSRGCNNSFYSSTPGKAPLVVDVGANIGYFTMLAASFGCRLMAFEPQYIPRLMVMASTLLNGYTNSVTVYPYALSGDISKGSLQSHGSWGFASVGAVGTNHQSVGTDQSVGRAYSIHGYGGGGGINTLGLKNFHPSGDDHWQIEMMPLSAIVQEDILLLKVDTEGFELSVMAGAVELLSKYKVHNVVMEVKGYNSPEKRQLLQMLVNAGLKYVYNYYEAYWAEVLASESFNLKDVIKDVTDVIVNRRDSENFGSEDFWLRREPLDI